MSGKQEERHFLHEFVEIRMRSDFTPPKGRVAKGEKRGFSYSKYTASLLVAFVDAPYAVVAEAAGTTVGVIKTWCTQPDFQGKVNEHRRLFAEYLLEQYAPLHKALFERVERGVKGEIIEDADERLPSCHPETWSQGLAAVVKDTIFFRLDDLVEEANRTGNRDVYADPVFMGMFNLRTSIRKARGEDDAADLLASISPLLGAVQDVRRDVNLDCLPAKDKYLLQETLAAAEREMSIIKDMIKNGRLIVPKKKRPEHSGAMRAVEKAARATAMKKR